MSKISTAPEVIDAQVGIDDRTNVSESPLATKPNLSKASHTRQRNTSQKASPSKKPHHAAGARTKQDLVLQMLRRKSGVSIEDIVAKTKWQPHSVRGFLSGVVRKKLKLRLASDVGKDSVRRYHIAPIASSKV
jgi:hypothetical protein